MSDPSIPDPINFDDLEGGIDLSQVSDQARANIEGIADRHASASPTNEEIDSLIAELQSVKTEAEARQAWLRMGVFAARVAARFAGVPI